MAFGQNKVFIKYPLPKHRLGLLSGIKSVMGVLKRQLEKNLFDIGYPEQ